MYRPIPRATRRKKKRYENTKNSKRVFVCARRSRSVERDRQTERETEKEIDRQTGRTERERKRRRDESRPFGGGLRGHGGVYWPRVNLDEEKQRGSKEEGTRREGEGDESPLADYVPSPPRSFTPAMFFLLLPFLPRPPMISPDYTPRALPRAFRRAHPAFSSRRA